MGEDEREKWDQRYREGRYHPRPYPSPFLEDWLSRLPSGRALDVACGAGRNALRLAAAGYQVDAVDISEHAIEMARTEAADRGLEVNWIVSDLDTMVLPSAAYDVIAVIRYVNRAIFSKLEGALAEGGWLVYEHHFRTDEPVDGPKDAEFRLEPGELLTAFPGLRTRFFEEVTEIDPEGRRMALGRLVASKDGGDRPTRSKP